MVPHLFGLNLLEVVLRADQTTSATTTHHLPINAYSLTTVSNTLRHTYSSDAARATDLPKWYMSPLLLPRLAALAAPAIFPGMQSAP